MCTPAACTGCQLSWNHLLCISLALSHVSLHGAWQSSCSIMTKGRITNKIKLLLLHMTDEAWSPGLRCHLWQVWTVTYDFSSESLCNCCRLTTTDTFPVRKIPLWLLFSHQGKQQYHCGYFPFPVESHQTILSFSPAWLLSEWLDNYFFPKNQRAPNSQQSAGSQHCPGWLWDLHQRLHRCLFQLPQVWQKGFPKACLEEHMKINSLNSKRSH